MVKPILDGAQDFSKFREGNYFYVDKTYFIIEWWSNDQYGNDVSLILHPRRFSKTLTLNTVEQFFLQLIDRGISKERIKKYGFAFRGKEVLIGRG